MCSIYVVAQNLGYNINSILNNKLYLLNINFTKLVDMAMNTEAHLLARSAL